MSQPIPSRNAADRNLLFGILALQMDFISRDALIKAMHAWVLEKAKPLGQILRDQGGLWEDAHALLEAMVQKHLEMHDHNPEKSLAALSSVGSVRHELKQIADPDLRASLDHVPAARQGDPDPYATRDPSVGTATSAGTRFRILRPHARGGLGEVFVAEDGELHREVALKEIQDRHADHPDSRARFVLEAEITGGLEHPGIVPVYGLGSYADGRPFYAMRFIRGDSLNEAINQFHRQEVPGRDPGERALAFRKLLGRFIDVCNAIAYAHSRGVLHRDVKPGNIMLGKYGETLLVDWGLAKLLGRPEADVPTEEQPLRPSSASGTAETMPGSAVGTPQYMSPEQAAGRLEELGPASDVYALGATLYSLLTGKPPFEGEEVGAVLQRVQKGDFPPPRQLNRQVSPALEALCLRAMALKPGDRYASPRALADDVEHWLADEPVTAYREPLRTRLARWGRRHRPLVTGAAVLLVTAVAALSVGLVLLGWKQAEVVQERNNALGERRKAQQAREVAEAINDFLLKDLLAAARPGEQGRDVTIRKALDVAATRVDKAFAGQPEQEAAVRLALGNTYRHLQLYEEAEPHLRRALELRRDVLGPEAPDTLMAVDSWACLLKCQGKLNKAEPLFRQNLETCRRVLGPEDRETLTTTHNLAQVLMDQGKLKEAEELDRQTLETRRRVLGPEHADTLDSMCSLATFLRGQGKLEEAETMRLKVLEVRRRVLGQEHPETLTSMNNLALILSDQGQVKKAEELDRQTLEIKRRVFGPESPATLTSMNNLAVILSDQNKLKEAEELHRQVLETRRRVLGPERPDTLLSMSNLSANLRKQGKLTEAEELYRQVVETRRRILGPEHPKTLTSMGNLVDLLQDRGKLEQAESLDQELLRVRRKVLPAGHLDIAVSLISLGSVLTAKGQAREAEPLLREALGIRQKALPKGDWRTGNGESVLGGCLTALGQHAEAEALLLAGYEKMKDAKGVPPRRMHQAVERIVTLYEGWGKAEQAAAWRAKRDKPTTTAGEPK